ncbi:MAG: hypothetical protein R6V75_03305 [Bacteroidales bacterium]
MKRIFLVTALTFVFLLGSSFKVGSSPPSEVPWPPYTMVDITAIDYYQSLYGSLYAVKVDVMGYSYEGNSINSSCTVVDPSDTSIWNMDVFFYTTFGHTAEAFVYVKETIESSWEELGWIPSDDVNAETTVNNYTINKISFDIFALHN